MIYRLMSKRCQINVYFIVLMSIPHSFDINDESFFVGIISIRSSVLYHLHSSDAIIETQGILRSNACYMTNELPYCADPCYLLNVAEAM